MCNADISAGSGLEKGEVFEGCAAIAITFYYDTGQLQFMHFVPV
jgi:hypothetical protein